MRRCGRPPTSSRGPTSGSRRPRRTGGRRPRPGLRGGVRTASSCPPPPFLAPHGPSAGTPGPRCGNRGRPCGARHSSFLFLSPYFFRSSFSALIRSPSHGWEGLSYFWRENFGSPNPSLLLLLLAALFLLRGLRGGDGGLLDHTDREARAPVAPGPLSADLLALLVPDPPVAPDHLHPVDVVPEPQLDVRAEQVDVLSGLPVARAVHHPVRDDLRDLPERRLELLRLRLREVPDPLRAGHAGLVGDDLRDPDPDPPHLRERVYDGPCPLEVRVREADDVPVVLLCVGRPDHRLRGGRGGGLWRGGWVLSPFGPRTGPVGEASSPMARSI